MSGPDVRGIMLQVLLALIPAFVVWTWLFGWGLLVNILIAAGTALVAEAIVLKLRGRDSLAPLSDGSAVVTAVLLAFALPPLVPWWIPVIGALFAIVIAKHLYGGLGFNPFNPAMVGYVVLLISFPMEMTQWVEPSLTGAWDGITAATPLDAARTAVVSGIAINESLGIDAWAWLAAAFALGGLWLLLRGIIQWTIPVTVITSVAALAAIFWGIDPERFASPWFHLVTGATVFCAFFIATDPVSAATTPRGRIVYAAGIGILIWVIRSFGGYPDAVAFAVLLMNMAAPALDHFFRPSAQRHAR